MIKRIVLIAVMAILSAGFFGASASAQLGKAQSNLHTALGGTGLEKDLDVSIGVVIKGLLSLVGTIFLILTIYAGILWMTAQGNDEKVTKAKNILQSAIIGLVITMAAYAITSFVTGSLSGGTTPTQQGTPTGGNICAPESMVECAGKSVGESCSYSGRDGTCRPGSGLMCFCE